MSGVVCFQIPPLKVARTAAELPEEVCRLMGRCVPAGGGRGLKGVREIEGRSFHTAGRSGRRKVRQRAFRRPVNEKCRNDVGYL